MLVNISDIKVKKRVRRDLGDLEPLKDSLRRYGLVNPITINNKNQLIAGERRLEAAKAIGWTSINAIVVDGLDPVTELEMELEENNQRKEFTDAELLDGYKRLERLRNPGILRRMWTAIKSFFAALWEFLASLIEQ
jgi:ParB family transcriptional regulator, chromosome partitioning protein